MLPLVVGLIPSIPKFASSFTRDRRPGLHLPLASEAQHQCSVHIYFVFDDN
eukprot:COSAG02_NODE_19421_length_882_cov_2.038314_1_plen_50_part_10